jgi:hypothetical protein
MHAANVQPNPKRAALTSNSDKRGLARRAASNAPVTDPIAIVEVRSPY